jgi:large subunit ribosomal protein L4
MPKKMRLAALRSVLSAKAAEAGIVVVDDFDVAEPKTRAMIETLNNWVGESTVLVLMPAKDQNYDNVTRSASNIESAKVLLASYLNVRDVLNFQKVVLPLKTIDALVAHLG